MWFRQDLRLSDHPALQAAIGQAMAQGGPVIAVYIWDQNQPDDSGWAMGSASRWWLHHSLQSLGRDLEKCGGRLIIRQGDPAAQLMDLVAQSGATALHATRMIEPYARTLDHHLAKSLPVPLLLHDGAFLHPPGSIRTQQGGGYKVFSQFWKAVLKAPEPDAPLPAPERGVFAPPTDRHSSLDLNDLSLLPRVDWAAGLSQRWLHSYGIGEDAAAARSMIFSMMRWPITNTGGIFRLKPSPHPYRRICISVKSARARFGIGRRWPVSGRILIAPGPWKKAFGPFCGKWAGGISPVICWQ
ncbi:hypothetical protein JCM17846_00430 [Iodidimonas nitroreducens]|uniref:Photolyase/cryptochrome alpha/beta domain-containing protein n=1 Tax=Iodidimonas nitroreducens TaxID=1236968 RepID=A0A5A7N255_9PROT|nr:hypothetical protein JCM17846_00430 [Iodidimonas nitroreducens]